MRRTTPSLVLPPIRSYGEIYLVMTVMGCVALMSCVAILVCLAKLHSARLTEPVEATLALRHTETTGMIDQCKAYLARAEDALARRKVSMASLQAPVVALEGLQAALPEEAWIHSLRMSGGSIELVINAISERVSAQLVDLVIATRTLVDPRLDSIERVQSKGVNLYEIRISARIGQSSVLSRKAL